MKRMKTTIAIRWWGVFFLLLSCSVQAQNKEKLEKNVKELQTQIRYNNKLLQQTEKSKKSNLNQISLLNDQIDKRNRLIRAINGELLSVGQQIENYEGQIVRLEREIEVLKEEYARIIVSTHRQMGQYDRLMMVLASKDFQQAYRRIRYFQEYSAHRKTQVQTIERKQEELRQAKASLEGVKQTKAVLLEDEQKEKKLLDSEKAKKNIVLTDLKKREKELRASIRKSQDEARRLEKQIQKIIAQEIEKARKEAQRREAERRAKEGDSKTPAQKPSSPDQYPLTPEERKLSNDFAANRGKLPWPTERGVISGHFGTRPHAELKGIMINNDGVDIMTHSGAEAQAVFSGIVTAVVSVSNDAKAIIIRHGAYSTVYTNLQSVSVKSGQKVEIKQKLGVIRTDTEENKTLLQFQLWKNIEKQNPAHWIHK